MGDGLKLGIGERVERRVERRVYMCVEGRGEGKVEVDGKVVVVLRFGEGR